MGLPEVTRPCVFILNLDGEIGGKPAPLQVS